MLRTGIDALEIERVQQSLDRFGERFMRRFFTVGEQQDCGDNARRLAARIAAKEAVAKALGTGIGDVSWTEIEIRSDERGRPVLMLHGAAVEVAELLGVTQWDVSLSHTDTTAYAVCVML